MLYILSGLPFAGKSSFAKKAEECTTLKRVSFDELWTSLVTVDPGITYELANAEIEKLLQHNLEQGISTIYDSTNLKENHRDALISIAHNTGSEYKIVYFYISVEEMKRRQAESLIHKTHPIVCEENIRAALEHNCVPDGCIVIETEADKGRLLREMQN